MSEYTDQERRALDILAGLGAHPAVPFHEAAVARHIIGLLDRIDGVDWRIDDFGNIIAHYGEPQAAADADAESHPPIAFVAHMDHPGYEIIRADTPDDGAESGGNDGDSGERYYIAEALGGAPVASMVKRTPAFALTADGSRIPAELLPMPDGGGAEKRLARVRLKSDARLDLPTAVAFDLPDFSIDGDAIRMRAADDLAGCGSILAALERLAVAGAAADFYAVFTRAEEGGLFGARLMAEAGALPKNALVASVEASPLIPGVEQGAGPVIRTGDRVYTFDADAEQALIAARDSIAARDGGFRCQRQLMSGGGCEATAFAVFGYSVTGLAFPLGNWHNATTTIPDRDGGVDSEYISVSDYLGGVALIAEAAVSVAKRNNSAVRRSIRSIPDAVRERMRGTAGGIGTE